MRTASGRCGCAASASLGEVVGAYTELMAAKDLRKSANELRRGWALATAYWEKSEPWKVVKADPDAAAARSGEARRIRKIAPLEPQRDVHHRRVHYRQKSPCLYKHLTLPTSDLV